MLISTPGKTQFESHGGLLGRQRPDWRPTRRQYSARMPSMLCVILALLLGLAGLASCAPAQPTVTAPPATVTPSATAIPRLVYQADWSHGLAGWSATPGWSVSGGTLETDTG